MGPPCSPPRRSLPPHSPPRPCATGAISVSCMLRLRPASWHGSTGPSCDSIHSTHRRVPNLYPCVLPTFSSTTSAVSCVIPALPGSLAGTTVRRLVGQLPRVRCRSLALPPPPPCPRLAVLRTWPYHVHQAPAPSSSCAAAFATSSAAAQPGSCLLLVARGTRLRSPLVLALPESCCPGAWHGHHHPMPSRRRRCATAWQTRHPWIAVPTGSVEDWCFVVCLAQMAAQTVC